MPAAIPQLEVKPPTIFTTGVVLSMSLYGLILVIPVFISMMVVSVLHFGALTFLVPLATIAVTAFFLPVGFGNPYVARLVRPLRPQSAVHQNCYVVQLTRNPRNRSGLLALLEDADDIGCLCFTESALVFNGDSVRLTLPYDQIKDLRQRNAGWRALFAYGSQTAFSVASLPEAGSFLFAERSSCLLTTSRRNANVMYQRLCEKIQMAVLRPSG